MLKRGPRLAAFLFFSFVFMTVSSALNAGDQVLFNKVFTLGNWHLHFSHHSFNAEDPGEGQLTLSKNTPQKNMQHGFLVFNGSVAFLRDFLNGDEIFFEKKVAIRDTNRLFVFFVGEPGASVTMQITRRQGPVPAPDIIAFAAQPSTIFRGASSTLSWQTENADACEIQPEIGAVDASGSIIVTPRETTTYTLTASGAGNPATASVTVTIENSAPRAEPQTVLTDEDTAVAITLSATDVDGDRLTYAITSQPGQGTLSGTPPALTYIPNQNYNGPDAFRFTASDGRIASNPATVSLNINPINDAPKARAGKDQTVFVGDLVRLDGSASSDVDEDRLNYSWSFVAAPAGSTAALSDASAVSPTFTPDIAGTYAAELVVNDGTVDSIADQVIIVANPWLVNVPNVVGRPQPDAETAIREENLQVGAVTFEHSETVLEGYVIIQEPAAGTTVAEGSSVDLVVSLGPAAAPEDVDYGFAENEQQGGGGLVGETIRILNGNALVQRSDLRFPSPNSMGLAFQAVYNSQSGFTGSSGSGWTHTYEAFLDPNYSLDGQTFVKIVDQTGRAHYFSEDSPAVYKGEFKDQTQVTAESDEYVWYRMDGSRYGFSSSGRLIWIDGEKRNRLVLGYDAQSRLETVTDSASGRTLTFHYLNGLLGHIAGPVTSAVSDGIWVTYGYDGSQNLTSVTYADGSGFNYTYNDPNDGHNLTEMRNHADHLLNTWDYDTQDRCIDNFSVNGTGAAINYVNPTQVNVTDAYGTVRTYTVAAINSRKRVTAMLGAVGAPYNDSNIIAWQYDTSMNLTEVETAEGTVHLYQDYDSRGNPGTVVLASGTPGQRTITYAYHPEMNVPLTRTEPSVLGAGNKVTTWDFDDDDNSIPNENPTRLISRIVDQGFTKDAAGATVSYEYATTFTYNSKGQVLSVDGPLPGAADTTSFAYEAATGNLQSVTQPLIGVTNFSNYDAAGQLGQVTDVNAQSETYTYDGRGRITAIMHQADSNTKTVSYNTAGLPELVTDEDGVFYSFEYDATYGRLVRKNDMDGNYIAYAYDSQGNLIERSKHDPAGVQFSHRRWNYQHPVIPGKLWKEIKYDDSFSEYGYDSDGNLNSATDFNLNTTTYEYDALNRLITVTQPGMVMTSYDYDLHGNLISVLDAENHETTFTYDDMGRVVLTTSPDSGTTAYVYDEAGNLKQKTDANAIKVQYAYDLLNRLIAVQFPDAAQDIGYSFDGGTNGKGRRTGMTDPSGSTTFGYDSRGRLTRKTTTVSGVQYVISRSYTPGSRLTSFAYPSGRTLDFTRYSNGKIQNLSTTDHATTVELFSNMTYDPFGRPSGMDSATGSAINNQSGLCNCLKKINPGKMMEHIFTQDSNGNIIDIQAPNVAWLSQSFVYDALNRLKSASGVYGTIDYAYDKVGNRLSRTAGNQSDTYSYVAGSNRLAQISGANPASFTYDASGNLTGMDLKTLVYNQNNRLIRVEEGSNVLGEYTYNGLGQRVKKDVDGVSTIFLYDFEGNVIAESNISGSMAAEYLYMGTNRLAKVGAATGSLYYFNNNYLGTPLLMTDSSGNVVWDADFKPFGEAHVNDNSSEENNFRFAGQYFDAETGLHYNWHRYYDPLTGRYLTPDPSHSIQPQGNSIPYLVPSLIDSPQDLNNYTYVNGNPINFIDPKGLWIYMGYCRYISGGLGAGVGQIRCRVWTECRSDGYLEVGELVAMFGGLTVGLPASVTYFNIEQNSRDLSKEPTLSDLEGLSSIYSVSSALGIGSSITTLNLGATTGESFGSYQAGVDASLDAFGGYSWIEWSKREKCCE